MGQLSIRLRRMESALCSVRVAVRHGFEPVHAQSEPAPDPAGIATGDKTNVTDAAGDSFVVPSRRTSRPRTTRRRRRPTTSIRPRRRRSRWR